MTKKELIKSLQYYSDDTDIMIAIPGPKKDSFYSSPILKKVFQFIQYILEKE